MEEWKLHKSGYKVSNYGNVKSQRLFRDGYRNMKFGKNHKGYYHVNIYGKSTFVHKLVVETFIGEIPKRMQINHKDGIKTNNKLENLEIVTPSQNRQHAFNTGLQRGSCGEKHSCAKLKEKHILNIYFLIDQGLTNRQISEQTKLTMGYINQIRKGEKWNYLFKQLERRYYGIAR